MSTNTYAQRKKWQQDRSAARQRLWPLRIKVNTALKRAGIPHATTEYSSMVKGWPMDWSAGWKTESDTYQNAVIVRITDGQRPDPKLAEYIEAATKALEPFGAIRLLTGNEWIVKADEVSHVS